ncbi:MAG: phosphoadenylyl-sulfate reductase [Rhodocyclaceae bacterium]|nr:phosphoadenylyl-sulfate reductase [Rhodocyclaceae bacterium]
MPPTFADLANQGLIDDVAEKTVAAIKLLRNIARDYQPVVFASSLGAEDMVLTDLIVRENIDIGLFTLDTGRLPLETYDLLAATEKHYNRKFDVFYPRHDLVEAYVREQGINGFYDSIAGRKACCHARKVEPLQRALDGKKAWITGLRASQAATRGSLKIQTWDDGNGLVKFNPLLNWSEAEVWVYIRANQVPYNKLHDRHYPSIGCAPCTRAVAAGEDVRAGRWWWESPATKECGLHVADGKLQRIKGTGT